MQGKVRMGRHLSWSEARMSEVNISHSQILLVVQMVESACNVGDPGWIPELRRSTSVFLPGKSHGERSLVGYSPWGHKELDTTE